MHVSDRQSQLDEARTKVENLQDQNALLKAQRNNNVVFSNAQRRTSSGEAPIWENGRKPTKKSAENKTKRRQQQRQQQQQPPQQHYW